MNAQPPGYLSVPAGHSSTTAMAAVHTMICSARLSMVRRRPASSAPSRLVDGSDVDLLHRHHRFERALGVGAAGGKRVGQCARGDLPREAPAVLAPAARAFLAAVADGRIPVAVRLGLIVRGDLERERLAVLEVRATVQSDAG